jgi:hypothetical protein
MLRARGRGRLAAVASSRVQHARWSGALSRSLSPRSVGGAIASEDQEGSRLFRRMRARITSRRALCQPHFPRVVWDNRMIEDGECASPGGIRGNLFGVEIVAEAVCRCLPDALKKQLCPALLAQTSNDSSHTGDLQGDTANEQRVEAVTVGCDIPRVISTVPIHDSPPEVGEVSDACIEADCKLQNGSLCWGLLCVCRCVCRF